MSKRNNNIKHLRKIRLEMMSAIALKKTKTIKKKAVAKRISKIKKVIANEE